MALNPMERAKTLARYAGMPPINFGQDLARYNQIRPKILGNLIIAQAQ